MKIVRSVTLWIFVALIDLPAWAQGDFPKVELFGGYSYLNAEPLGSRWHAHGWGVGLTGNFHRHFGMTADFAGGYGREEGLLLPSLNLRNPSFRFKTHDFLFGPRVAVRTDRITGFGHALFGVVNNRVSGTTLRGPTIEELIVGPFSRSSTSFAMGFGGGVDANLTKRVAIRLLQVDYIPVRQSYNTLHNIRLKSGNVFRFGF